MKCKNCGHGLEDHESSGFDLKCWSGSGNGNRCECQGFEPEFDPGLCEEDANKDKLLWAGLVLERQIAVLTDLGIDMMHGAGAEAEPIVAGVRAELESLKEELER